MTDKNRVLMLATVKVHREEFKIEDFTSPDSFLMLVEEGSFSIESEAGKFVVNSGECAHLKPNVSYARKIIKPAKIHIFRYQAPDDVVGVEHLTFKDKNRISSTINLLNHIDDLLSIDDFERKTQLFFDIINQYILENKHSVEINKEDALIKDAVLKIQSKLSENLPFTELSQESGLSYVQFLRRFKAYTGLTPSEYVIALKMKKATELLTDSRLQIKEISGKLGFENEYYFSNFFKKHLKVSPSAYRKIIT